MQCREISRESQIQPSEAALATLPHYLHPSVPMERSEVQAQYRNPFQVGKSQVPCFLKTFLDTGQRVLQL